MEKQYFLGIDAGANGAAAVIDRGGEFRAAFRWAGKGGGPGPALEFLRRWGPGVRACYIEQVQIFRQLPVNTMLAMQSLLINCGIWQGLCTAAGIEYGLIKPVSWQARAGAPKKDRWRVAAKVWPDAGIRGPAHDGIADALFIASAARVDAMQGELFGAGALRRSLRGRKSAARG